MPHILQAEHHQRVLGVEPLVQAGLVLAEQDNQPPLADQLGQVHACQGRGDHGDRRLDAQHERIAAQPREQGCHVIAKPHAVDDEGVLVLDRHAVGELAAIGGGIDAAVQINARPIRRDAPGREPPPPRRLDRHPLVVLDGVHQQRKLRIRPPQGGHVVQEHGVAGGGGGGGVARGREPRGCNPDDRRRGLARSHVARLRRHHQPGSRIVDRWRARR